MSRRSSSYSLRQWSARTVSHSADEPAISLWSVMIAVMFLLVLALVPQLALAQQPFVTHCATCHGEDGRGTARGPGSR